MRYIFRCLGTPFLAGIDCWRVINNVKNNGPELLA
jgi:hypothetical protein